MAPVKRQMHLGVFWLGAGNHSAGWRYEGAWSSNSSWPLVAAGAQIAERGKFDLFFISDSLVMDPGDHPAFVSRFEPTTLIAALAAVTRHVGLGATVSTSFSEPFDVARTFMTLHNISGGRAAWNIVTSSHNAAAANFSKERLPEHDLRYEIAGEFVDVVRGLWSSYDRDAFPRDKATITVCGSIRKIRSGSATRTTAALPFRLTAAKRGRRKTISRPRSFITSRSITRFPITFTVRNRITRMSASPAGRIPA